jgi:hypothetical protein
MREPGRAKAYPICFWRVSSAVENGDEGLKLHSGTSFAAWLFCTQQKKKNKKKKIYERPTCLVSVWFPRNEKERETKRKQQKSKQQTLPEHRERS